MAAVDRCLSKCKRLSLVIATGCIALSAACTSQAGPATPPSVPVSQAAGTSPAADPGSPVAPRSSSTVPTNPDAGPLTLRSPAFTADGLMPVDFSCAGDNTSPPLSWHGAAPTGTVTWAIVMQDVDVRPAPWIQWMVTGIPVGTRSVPAGQIAPGSMARRVSNSTVGFVGVCPPQGQVHRYRFTVYALPAQFSIAASGTAAQSLGSIQQQAKGTAALTGRFGR